MWFPFSLRGSDSNQSAKILTVLLVVVDGRPAYGTGSTASGANR